MTAKDPSKAGFKIGDCKPPKVTQFSGERANPSGDGPRKGARYLKSALKRQVVEHPEQVDEIAKKLLDDARGATKVEVAVHVGKGETATEQIQIAVADRQRAAGMILDRLDGKPVQEIDVAGAPTTHVIIAHATGALDPKLSAEIDAIVNAHEEEAAESVDLSDPHPEPEVEPDEPDPDE